MTFCSYISHCLGETCNVISPSAIPYPTTVLHAILQRGFLLNICASCSPIGLSNSFPFVTPTTQVAHVPSLPQSPDPPESNLSAYILYTIHCYIEMFAINAAESQRRIVTNNTVCKISSSHTTHEFVIQLDPSCQHSPT